MYLPIQSLLYLFPILILDLASPAPPSLQPRGGCLSLDTASSQGDTLRACPPSQNIRTIAGSVTGGKHPYPGQLRSNLESSQSLPPLDEHQGPLNRGSNPWHQRSGDEVLSSTPTSFPSTPRTNADSSSESALHAPRVVNPVPACDGPSAQHCLSSCRCNPEGALVCDEFDKNVKGHMRDYHGLSLMGLCGPVCVCNVNGAWKFSTLTKNQWDHLGYTHGSLPGGWMETGSPSQGGTSSGTSGWTSRSRLATPANTPERAHRRSSAPDLPRTPPATFVKPSEHTPGGPAGTSGESPERGGHRRR